MPDDPTQENAPSPIDGERDGKLLEIFDRTSVSITAFKLEPPLPLDIPLDEQIDWIYANATVSYINTSMATTYGYDSYEELMGARIGKLMPKENPENVAMLKRLSETDYTLIDWESVEEDKDGNRIYLLNSNISYQKNGCIHESWVFVTDITEWRELRDDVKLRVAAFEEASEGCLIIDSRQESFPILYANQAFLDLTGRSKGEVVGSDPRDLLVSADTNREEVERIDQAIRDAEKYKTEIQSRRKNGESFWMELSVSPVRNRFDMVTHYIAIFNDITERRIADHRIIELQAENAHYARIAVFDELSSSIAHEINQPLAAILGNAQAALRMLNNENPDLDEFREILEDIVSDNRRTSSIINRLREMTRKLPPRRDDVNLNELVESSISLFHSELIIKNVFCKTDLEENLPNVSADRVQIQQVIINLIKNAAEEIFDSGIENRCLEVATSSESGCVRLAVRDFGRGVPEDRIDEIFDPFVSTKDEGMGMGLKISRSIVENHKGRLRLDTSASPGALFRFELPTNH